MQAGGNGWWPKAAMSRQEAIRWLALRLAAAGTAAFWATGAAILRPFGGIRPATGAGRTGRPCLEAHAAPRPSAKRPAAAPDRPDVQAFRSRPDLHPPATIVAVAPDRAAAPGFVFTDCHFGPGQQGPLVIDGDGGLVWFLPLSADATSPLRAFNVRVQSYRKRPVLTWFEGVVVHGHGQGHYVLYDCAYRPIARVSARNGYQGDLHDFVLTDRGTALFTCYGRATADLTALGGARKGDYTYGVVQEVDVATGRLLFEWRSDEHVPLGQSYAPPVRSGIPWDYFHLNSICVDPTDGNLIVSGRNTSAFYKIDRSSGSVLWRVGGKASDFRLGRGAHFAFQHDVQRGRDGTVTMFDNEAGLRVQAPQSRALVLMLDERSRTASVVRQYHHSPPVLSDALGSVQDLPRGHRFVGWGTSTYFTEYDSSGRPVLDARLAPGTESYRAFKQPWQGLPAEPPALAVAEAATAATAYASWNGATEVDRWVVLGGPGPHCLQPVADARRSGFETAIPVARPPSHLAVEAVDRTGRHLGRSAVHTRRA